MELGAAMTLLQRLGGTVRKGGPATRGYVLVRRKPYRNWLQHRAVVDTLVKQWNPFGWDRLPDHIQVHHMDFGRANNEPTNLLISPPELHPRREPLRCPYTGRFLSVHRVDISEEYLEALTS